MERKGCQVTRGFLGENVDPSIGIGEVGQDEFQRPGCSFSDLACFHLSMKLGLAPAQFQLSLYSLDIFLCTCIALMVWGGSDSGETGDRGSTITS